MWGIMWHVACDIFLWQKDGSFGGVFSWVSEQDCWLAWVYWGLVEVEVEVAEQSLVLRSGSGLLVYTKICLHCIVPIWWYQFRLDHSGNGSSVWELAIGCGKLCGTWHFLGACLLLCVRACVVTEFEVGAKNAQQWGFRSPAAGRRRWGRWNWVWLERWYPDEHHDFDHANWCISPPHCRSTSCLVHAQHRHHRTPGAPSTTWAGFVNIYKSSTLILWLECVWSSALDPNTPKSLLVRLRSLIIWLLYLTN